VKLVGGVNQLEGNVLALNPKTGIFGPICDDGWKIENVSFNCRLQVHLETIFNTK